MECSSCSASLAPENEFCGKCGARRPALDPAFARAEASYARHREQYRAGTLPADQFQAVLEAEMIDHGGRYWMIGMESGAWHAHDGQGWVKATPPLAGGPARPPLPATSHAGAGPAALPLPVRDGGERSGSGLLSLGSVAGFALCVASSFLPWISAARYDFEASDFSTRTSVLGWSDIPSLPLADLLGTRLPVDAAFLLLLALVGVVLRVQRLRGAVRLDRTAALLGATLAAIGIVLMVSFTGEGLETKLISSEPMVFEAYGLVDIEVGLYALVAGGLIAAICSFLDRKTDRGS